jgi:hypothetical protein
LRRGSRGQKREVAKIKGAAVIFSKLYEPAHLHIAR